MVDEESLSYLYAKKKNNIYAQIIQFFWKKKWLKKATNITFLNSSTPFSLFKKILSLAICGYGLIRVLAYAFFGR